MTCTPFSSRLSDFDLHLLGEGRHNRLYDKLGAHVAEGGTHFAVWAPNAAAVSVVGDFNDWRADAHPMRMLHENAGVWTVFVPSSAPGQRYAFEIVSRRHGQRAVKADPFAFRSALPPDRSSVIWDLDYAWEDDDWCRSRAERNALDRPFSIYELHLGSWRRAPEAPDRPLDYRTLAPQIADYCGEMGFTHVELLPVMEHPFYGSWGYQVTGYFAATARYGAPQDLMYLIDYLHRHDIGVILDWVPAHFPADEHGLARFDGTHLFEHEDPREGFHPEWNTCIFNYGRNEVRAFLLSSALFWLDRFHADGLRVDGVASMLYRDYGRVAGEWLPNVHGGRENLEAVAFLRQLNGAVDAEYPDRVTMAEESTAWPGVSRPADQGGLGFAMKWNLGWMHDTLAYFQRDPVHRRFHHDELTFSLVYAFHENFVLPLSHDEVVHGKRSLLGRMPGDDWQRYANMRLLLGYMWAHPGKPLLFMGGEFGQAREWNHDASLDWHLLEQPRHAGIRAWVADLNRCYLRMPALYRRDFDADGFRWLEADDAEHGTVAFLRHGGDQEWVLVVCNNTPVIRENYRLGVPVGGFWNELLNSDAQTYGGSGQGNLGGVAAVPVAAHGYFESLTLRLPPLSVLFLAPRGSLS